MKQCLPNSKIPILEIIAAGPVAGGGSAHVFDLVTHLPKLNFIPEIIAPPGHLIDRLTEAGFTTWSVKMDSAFDRSAENKLEAVFLKWLEKFEQGLIHLHGVRAGFLGRRALGRKAQENRIPIIYTEHLWTNDYHLKNPLREHAQFVLMRRFDSVTTQTIAVSEAVKTFLLDHKITQPDKITVIQNGVTLSSEPPISFDPDRNKNGQFRIGCIGGLIDVKNYPILFRALKLILQNHPRLTLEIIGNGPGQNQLEKIANQLRVSSAIKWHGYLKNSHRVIRDWDLYVTATRSESFGLSIAEAMAEGLPVVAPEVGAVPELVTPETGRLVAKNDPHELAKAVIDLLPRFELRKKMGQAACERITRHFSLDQMINRTADLYQKLAIC